jgi:hypothetical protein
MLLQEANLKGIIIRDSCHLPPSTNVDLPRALQPFFVLKLQVFPLQSLELQFHLVIFHIHFKPFLQHTSFLDVHFTILFPNSNI